MIPEAEALEIRMLIEGAHRILYVIACLENKLIRARLVEAKIKLKAVGGWIVSQIETLRVADGCKITGWR